MANGIIEQVRQALKEGSDQKTKSSYERFFKEEVQAYGVKTAEVTQIGKLACEPKQ